MLFQIKYETNGFKKGDMVVSNQAAKGHQSPYKIESFFCWDNKIEVHLENNNFIWSIDVLEHYDPKIHIHEHRAS